MDWLRAMYSASTVDKLILDCVKNHNQQKKIENYYWKNMDKKKNNKYLLDNYKKGNDASYECKENQTKVKNKRGNWEKAFSEELNRHKETLNINYVKPVQRQLAFDYAKPVQRQRAFDYAKPVVQKQRTCDQYYGKPVHTCSGNNNDVHYVHGAKRKPSPYYLYGESCTEKESSVGIDCDSVQAHVGRCLSCQTKLEKEQKIELLIKNTVCPAHSCQDVEVGDHMLKRMSIIIDLKASDNYSNERKGKIVVNRECYDFNNLKSKHSSNHCRVDSGKNVEIGANGIEINIKGKLIYIHIN